MRTLYVLAAVGFLGGTMGLGSDLAAQQNTDPRIGVWQNVNNPGNVMNYDAIANGGTRLRVDAVNQDSGDVTSYWGYDAFFDGSWHPVTGTNRTGEEEEATVNLLSERTTEIRYRDASTGELDRVLENVVSPNGNTLWVIFRDSDGEVTNIAIYQRVE